MRKFGLILALGVLALPPLAAQVSNPSIVIVASDPSGSTPCNLPWRWNALGSGDVWYPANPVGNACTWAQLSGGGGGGPYLPLAGGPTLVTSAPFYASGAAQSTTTSGSNAAGTVITVASCIDFTQSSAGVAYGYEGVYIAGAGAAGADYVGTVTTCIGTALTVNPATSTTVSSGTLILHDDTAAIQACMNLANATTSVTCGFPNGTYNVNGPFQNAAGANGILIVPSVPYVATTLAAPYSLALSGVNPENIGGPQAQGAVIQTRKTATQGANYFGAILSGYSAPGTYGNQTNVALQLNNLIFRTYDNPQITAINADSIVNLTVRNITVDTGLSVLCGYVPGNECNGSLTAPTVPTNPYSYGIITPQQSSLADDEIENVHIIGYYGGIEPQEHSTLNNVVITYGVNCFRWNVSGHSASAVHINAEKCTNGMYGVATAISVDDYAVEGNTYDISDAANGLHGIVNYEAVYNTNNLLTLNGAHNLILNSLMNTVPNPGFAPQITYSGAVFNAPLSEGFGTTGYDITKLANNLACSGTAAGSNGHYSAGSISQWAEYFDGSTNICTTGGNITGANLGKTIAVSFWMNATTVSSASLGVIAEYSSNFNSNANTFLIAFNTTNPGDLSIYMHGSGGYNTGITGTTNYSGAKHFIVAVIDTTQAIAANQLILYVDGVSVPLSCITTCGDILFNPFGTFALNLGARNGASLFYGGTLQDFRIYNYAPSSFRIAQMYAGIN